MHRLYKRASNQIKINEQITLIRRDNKLNSVLNSKRPSSAKIQIGKLVSLYKGYIKKESIQFFNILN